MKKNKKNSKSKSNQPNNERGPLKELKKEDLEKAAGGYWSFGCCDMDGVW